MKRFLLLPLVLVLCLTLVVPGAALADGGSSGDNGQDPPATVSGQEEGLLDDAARLVVAASRLLTSFLI